MASGDPHISFSVRRVHHHSRGCCTTAKAHHRRECGHEHKLRFSWLKANFEYLPSTANEWEVMQAIRAYIMHLIGGVLMPDANASSTTDPSAMDIGGCLILLQSWALY
ncbi:hypothetical protein CXB51_007565 [Gossypium anomalum]|uniref:Uncharacterized protein n=1 Tax=Gossypium anomalum TaxID=47600 RepID=A0A8J5Z9H8_9ROSI|nr:hypothetical protein CXB51_007565 [Gossypium anomalum]